MAKNSDNLLGMGGQRSTVSRTVIRGGNAGGKGGPNDEARERKQELLRKLRDRNSQPERDTAEDTEGTV